GAGVGGARAAGGVRRARRGGWFPERRRRRCRRLAVTARRAMLPALAEMAGPGTRPARTEAADPVPRPARTEAAGPVTRPARVEAAGPVTPPARAGTSGRAACPAYTAKASTETAGAGEPWAMVRRAREAHRDQAPGGHGPGGCVTAVWFPWIQAPVPEGWARGPCPPMWTRAPQWRALSTAGKARFDKSAGRDCPGNDARQVKPATASTQPRCGQVSLRRTQFTAHSVHGALSSQSDAE